MTKPFDPFDELIRESQRKVAANYEGADVKDVTLAAIGWLADRLENAGRRPKRDRTIINIMWPTTGGGIVAGLVLVLERVFM